MPQRVLLIEDNADARYIYAASLKHARLEVVDVGTALAARDAARTKRPDVIVLDRKLPDCDGLDLARHWRSASALATVPIIVLSAYTTRPDVEAALAAGCDAFLAKPCPGDILVAHVMKLLLSTASTQKIRKAK
jgi:DNA-binding response OmpR family regulator